MAVRSSELPLRLREHIARRLEETWRTQLQGGYPPACLCDRDGHSGFDGADTYWTVGNNKVAHRLMQASAGRTLPNLAHRQP